MPAIDTTTASPGWQTHCSNVVSNYQAHWEYRWYVFLTNHRWASARQANQASATTVTASDRSKKRGCDEPKPAPARQTRKRRS